MTAYVIVGIVVAIVILLALLGLISRYRVPGADEAFVVTGTGKGHTGKVYRGTGTFVLPVVQRSTRVSLASVQAELTTSTPAGDGIMLTVAAVAQVKVGDEPEDVLKAAQRFRDDTDKIRVYVTEQLSGELRSIVGTMTAKSILVDRQELIEQVATSIKANLRIQGLVLDAFAINDVSDADGSYFSDLAATERAEQARIAAEARAVASASAAKVEAEQTRIAEEARIANDQAVIEKSRELEVQKERARELTERARAEADAAGPLAEAERRLIQTEKDNEVAVRQAELRDTELDAEVKRPADARRYETEQSAEADKAKRIAEAEAEAQEIRAKGEAEAAAILARGRAEAEAIEMRAAALTKLDAAGQLELILDRLPAVVAAAAEPMTGAHITLVGPDTGAIGSSVAGTAAGALELFSGLTGVDVKAALAQFTADAGADRPAGDRPAERGPGADAGAGADG